MKALYRDAAGRAAVRQWCETQLDRWEVPHRREVLETSLGPTHLLTVGTAGRPLLYLPGTNFNAAASRPLLGELARQHRVTAADVPGQPGLSSGRRPAGDRLEAYGRWVGELVQHLSCESLVVVGHSLGAAIALAAEPTRIAGLVLLNPAGLVGLRVRPTVLAATLGWLTRPGPGSSRRLLRYMHTGGEPPAMLAEWMTIVARHTRTTGAPGPLPEQTVRRWRGAPRLIVSGEHDCFLPVPRLAGTTRDLLGRELTVLSGVGHLLPEQAPSDVAALVTDLLDSPSFGIGDPAVQ